MQVPKYDTDQNMTDFIKNCAKNSWKIEFIVLENSWNFILM